MKLEGKRIVSLVHHEFEDLELWYPILRLREEGAEVDMAGEYAKEKYIGKYGVPAESDCAYYELKAEDYDAVLIPGGWAPDKIRRFPKVLDFIKEMNEQGKIIGQICHAGWVSISAKILKNRTVTSTIGIKDDMENAGAIWVDEKAVTDKNIVSAQRPPDLPLYLQHLIRVLAQ